LPIPPADLPLPEVSAGKPAVSGLTDDAGRWRQSSPRPQSVFVWPPSVVYLGLGPAGPLL